ncbi:MAG: nucleotidyltransferase domain-containing protein [Nanoarchaeota archaeon]|nr:nucleotidyltransferase domain-containing protein [Nanoarchaeota archaeon]
MMLDVCLGTRTAWKILFVLGEAPGKAVSRKEIQHFTGIGNKALSKFLILLEKFSIISSMRNGNAYYYRINYSNNFARLALDMVQQEKQQLNSPEFIALSALRELVYEITNVNLENIRGVVLFGSYAKKTYNPSSDIDAAIIVKEKSPSEEIIIAEIIDKIKKRFGKEIQPHYFTEDEFNAKTKFSEEIRKDGVVLM